MRVVAVLGLVALLAVGPSAARLTAKNADGCDFHEALAACSKQTNATRCDHWTCLSNWCPGSALQRGFAKQACSDAAASEPFPPRTSDSKLLGAGESSALVHKPPHPHHKKQNNNNNNNNQHKKHEHEHKKKNDNHGHKNHGGGGGGVPDAASPCGLGDGAMSKADIHAHLHKVSMDVYKERAHEHYTEAAVPRWEGIHDHVCPGKVPATSDCSSTVTWVYWTLFGKGNDFINGEDWTAGYTGTQIEHGTNVGSEQANLEVGDLCFYYQPIAHVAIYVGNGMIVSHGMDPVGFYKYNDCGAPLQYCRRYI